MDKPEKRPYVRRQLQPEPKDDSIRLDLLRLVHRHDLSPEQIIERAEKFERYVRQTADKA